MKDQSIEPVVIEMDRTVFEAAESGDFKGLRLTNDLDKILTHEINNTVLHVAVWSNNKSFAEQALKHCPSLLLKPNKRGETPLHTAAAAAKSGDTLMAGLLLRSDSAAGDVERAAARDLMRAKCAVKGDTALHVGVRRGHRAVVEFLVNEDVVLVDIVNDAGESPLFLAVEGGFVEIAKYIMTMSKRCGLFEHLFDGSHGRNALHAAVVRTRRARILENQAPDLSLENLRRLIRGFVFRLEECYESLCSDKRETGVKVDIILKLLLSTEENRSACDLVEKQDEQKKWTPLHLAASLGHIEATKLILEHKHCNNNINGSVAYLRDKEGMSALHIAAREGHVGVMKELVRLKPEACDLTDVRGRTALHVAVAYGRLNVVKYILKTPRLEFLLNLGDKDEGNTALHMAMGKRNWCIMKALIDDVRVDKRATNLKHYKPIDILRVNADIGELIRSWFIKKLERQGGLDSVQSILQRGEHINQQQPTHTNDNNDAQNDNKARKSHRLKKISDTHLLVAGLIATVTFTAAFTIPGGYKEEGDGPGKAMLAEKTFFTVFVVADWLAFFCSSASLLLHFFSSVEHNYHLLLRFTRLAATLAYVSVLGMVVAFTAALRVVMPPSSALYDFTLVAGLFCVFLFIIGCL